MVAQNSHLARGGRAYVVKREKLAVDWHGESAYRHTLQWASGFEVSLAVNSGARSPIEARLDRGTLVCPLPADSAVRANATSRNPTAPARQA